MRGKRGDSKARRGEAIRFLAKRRRGDASLGDDEAMRRG